MAKLQIFVLALVLVQAYCTSVSISNLPSQIAVVPETRPLPIPEVEVEQPVCVTYVKLLLQAIIDKLSDLPVVNRPSPEILPEDEILAPEVGSPENAPEVSTPEAANPCVACFEYINTLITSAQKVAASRR